MGRARPLPSTHRGQTWGASQPGVKRRTWGGGPLLWAGSQQPPQHRASGEDAGEQGRGSPCFPGALWVPRVPGTLNGSPHIHPRRQRPAFSMRKHRLRGAEPLVQGLSAGCPRQDWNATPHLIAPKAPFPPSPGEAKDTTPAQDRP